MEVYTVFLLVLCVRNSLSKIFSTCEFAKELYTKHNIPQEDIYKHFCVGGNFNTKSGFFSKYIGIYNIGTEWWCGRYEAEGNCNIECYDLLDDDISDDVKCMQMIFDDQGLNAWGKSRERCIADHQQRVNDCFAVFCKNCLIT